MYVKSLINTFIFVEGVKWVSRTAQVQFKDLIHATCSIVLRNFLFIFLKGTQVTQTYYAILGLF